MTRHPLSIVGAWITTLSAFIFLFVFLIDLFGLHSNPYFGLVFFLILPMFFVLGLLMIPAGIFLERRRQRTGLAAAPHASDRPERSDSPAGRSSSCSALTIANVLIVSLAAYRGVEYMDSPQFCGQVCHTVMEPEYVAHREGPHSRVTCVECHVGSGAQSFVYYKLNGMRQLVASGARQLSQAGAFAGLQPPSGPQHLRDVPLAGEVPWRQGGDRARNTRATRRTRASRRACSFTSAAACRSSGSAPAFTGTPTRRTKSTTWQPTPSARRSPTSG